ncbi:MAG: putative invasin, partial [Actinomycetia bacterium]|nr:putative invasin [Actinomycetes bacterium]
AVTVTGPGGTATVTHTGGTNTYIADGLSSGTYTVTITATDHDDQTLPPITIADGDNYTDTVTLQKWAPISIHVQGVLGGTTTDLTSVSGSVNAVRTLLADGVTTTSTPALTFSGGTNGIYTSISAAPPGTYVITVNPTNYVADTAPPVVVTSGTTASQASLVVKHLPQVTITTRTKLGSSTSALNAATVTITGPGVTATLTHAAGTNVHTMVNLPVGTYDITATADDGLHDPQPSYGVTLAAGQSYTDIADLLEWTAFAVRLRGVFNGTPTDLTTNAGDLSAVRVLDAQGLGGLTGQPTILFTGGPNGVYTSTTKVRPGTYTTTGTPANYDRNDVDSLVVAGTTPAQALLLVQKSPALTVAVNDVLDGNGNPLAGATVTVCRLNTGGTGCTGGAIAPDTTDAAGLATFSGLVGGRYRVIITETNHVSQTFTGNSGATQGVVVSSGSAATLTVDLLQHPPLTLTLLGRNGSSSPFNTTFDLPGATATMTATSGGTTTTLTAPGGVATYTAAHVVPGTYTLSVTAPGYTAMTSQTGIVIAAGVTHAALAGTLTAIPGSITGTVTESLNDNPLNNVLVTATSVIAPARTATATTNASGVYSIAGLEPGAWSVAFSLATYGPLNLPSVTVVRNAASTADAVLVQLGEHITGTLKGYDADPITITSNNPSSNLAGALVSITRSGYVATATTDVNGAYEFADIPANTYTLSFAHDNYKTLTLTNGLTTSVAGASNRTGDSLIAHTGTATITVKDLELTPGLVATATIRVSGNHLASPLTDTSGADGVTTFELPPGSYTASLATPPPGYLATAPTVPIAMGPSPGITATATLGSGTSSDTFPISKAVSVDVTVAGLTGSDTADLAITWPGGTATATGVSTHALFDELPPNKAFTIQATNAKYTGGATSAGPLFLGDSVNATATLIPKPGTVEVQVDGLINGNKTKVTLDGVQSTDISDGGTYTFTNVRAGATLNVTYSNDDYVGAPLTIPALLAEENRTDSGTGHTGLVNLTTAAKDGSVAVTVSGLLYGETATLTLTGANPRVINNVTNGVTTVANLTADAANTFTLTAANYTNPVGTSVTLLANENTPARPISIALTRETGSIDVTAGPPGLTATAAVTATVTWNAGAFSATGNGTGPGVITVSGLPSGVPLTITLTSPGLAADGPKSTTLTAGELHKDVGTINLT